MKKYWLMVAAAIAAVCFVSAAPAAHAQISVGINIGAAPACPYGYFDYAPYACAPYGYYGPEWFHGGAFVGAGPWFHGPASFHGHVNNHFDPQHGYKGSVPNRGDRPNPANRVDHVKNFKSNETRDGKGHSGR